MNGFSRFTAGADIELGEAVVVDELDGFVYPTDKEQDEKPMHVQAAEILGHIHNRDYGIAESKARLLRDQLAKGDWTLGSEKSEVQHD